MQKKERDLPLSRSAALTEAVAAGAMIAVASVADVDGRELAVHAVAVVLAVCHPAGDAAVDSVLHIVTSLSAVSMRKNHENIGNAIDKPLFSL